MTTKGFRMTLWPAAWPFLVSLGMLVSFYAAGAVFMDGYVLDLGSILLPTVRYTYFILFWIVLGTGAAIFLAWGGLRLLGNADIMKKVQHRNENESDKRFIVMGAILGFMIPCLIRIFVLQGVPLTDDESSYRFMAELISGGRIRALSPPMKLFFDNVFMINDGHIYSQYFLGWPMLMSPGVFLKATGFMNAIYSGLTVIPLFLIIRRLTGSRYAQLGIILYITSPMLMVGSATELSHTSCLLVLSWMIWLFLRIRDEDSPLWAHLGFGGMIGLALFIRPLTSIAVAGPFMIAWIHRVALRSHPARIKRILCMVFPLLAFAVLFFAVNKVQNGDYLKTGYQRYLEYSGENHFRFSLWAGEPGASLVGLKPGLVPWAKLAVGFLRVNIDLLGWPLLFSLLLPLSWKQNHGRLIALSFITIVGTSFVIQDAGIDTFGPVHLYEAGLPAILFIILGVKSISRFMASWTSQQSAKSIHGNNPHLVYAPQVMVIALVLVSLVGYAPFRIKAIRSIAENINTPFAALKEAGIHNAVIFTSRPFIRQEPIAPTKHFVFFRPNNDPNLKNDVLWVNHISLEENMKLMQEFPQRKGFVMVWEKDYRVTFLPLENIEPGPIPSGMAPEGGRPD